VTGLDHSGIGKPMPPRSAGTQALAELRGRITELEAELAAERSHRADLERERDRLMTEIAALRAEMTRRWWRLWRRAG
jgi:hypothetical protein